MIQTQYVNIVLRFVLSQSETEACNGKIDGKRNR